MKIFYTFCSVRKVCLVSKNPVLRVKKVDFWTQRALNLISRKLNGRWWSYRRRLMTTAGAWRLILPLPPGKVSLPAVYLNADSRSSHYATHCYVSINHRRDRPSSISLCATYTDWCWIRLQVGTPWINAVDETSCSTAAPAAGGRATCCQAPDIPHL